MGVYSEHEPDIQLLNCPVLVTHGAEVRIDYSPVQHYSRPIRHQTLKGDYAPQVKSFKDGVRVGCTFITNEAIEYIYKKHKEFLNQDVERTHQ